MSPDYGGERYTPSVSPSDFRILVKALMSQQMPTFLKEATLREEPRRGLGENRGDARPPGGSVLAGVINKSQQQGLGVCQVVSLA